MKEVSKYRFRIVLLLTNLFCTQRTAQTSFIFRNASSAPLEINFKVLVNYNGLYVSILIDKLNSLRIIPLFCNWCCANFWPETCPLFMVGQVEDTKVFLGALSPETVR